MYNKVYIEITNTCNMNCSFCHGHKRPQRKMNIDEFSLILDKLQGYTKYIYYHLMGEPLIHPDISEFIKLANSRGYKSIITTNGTLINKRKNELLDAKIHKINLSLHSFEKDNVEAHRKYVHELAQFAKRAAKQGTIVVFRLWNKGFDNGRNEISLNVLQETFPGDWTNSARGIKIDDQIYLEYGDRFEWPDINAEIKGNKFFCYGLKDQFGVLSDGTVVPCCLDSDGIINLGNIFKEDINAILSSERAKLIVQEFKRGKASEELCKKCGYAQRFV